MRRLITVEYDSDKGNQSEASVIDNIGELRSLISRLDGEEHTVLTFYFSPSKSVTIGGGNNGRYVCYAELNDGLFDLVNKRYIEGEPRYLLVNAGGQIAEKSTKYIVCICDVMAVSKCFFETGSLSSSFNWDSVS